ncbi:MAG TPA: acyloxyacyl hydrolase [Allosphingosinicella sp.]|nr:acyloxyacyl hydrolase [Allosphingosinicella sp.]
MKRLPIVAAAACALLPATPASAGELFGGLYVHDVDTPFNKGGYEGGLAVSAGFRGGRIKGLKGVGAPSPYVLVSVSTDGGTNLAAAGLSWKIGHKVYLRPGIGLAIHDRSSNIVYGNLRGDFGSRVLFEPELGLGVQVSERVSVEASWLHVSHAGLFNGAQNPGMDNIGLRLNFRL